MDEEPSDEKKFVAESSKNNRAKCKKCKEVLNQGMLRIAKVVPNPFGDGKMMAWHHPQCLVNVFAKQRASTAKITCVNDIGGWDDLSMEHQKEIFTTFPEIPNEKLKTHNNDVIKKTDKLNKRKSKLEEKSSQKKQIERLPQMQEYKFKTFWKLCMNISLENGHLKKMEIIKEFFDKISSKESSNETRAQCLFLWCKMLLPNSEKRIYNLQSKQLIKLFSQLFKQNIDLMLEDLEKGDIAETIKIFFEKSNNVDSKPSKKSTLTLSQVDRYLDKLSHETTEAAQLNLFKSISMQCTENDLKMIIRLIRHDLRINCGPKYILGAIHPDAYEAYQTSHNLKSVIEKACSCDSSKIISNTNSKINIKLSLLTPILPMLAEPCKNLDGVFKKCLTGIYSEIKYDGERVQLHKCEKEFKFFSRSLKPVLGHKVDLFKEFIPKAFQHGKEIILDCEVLMYDHKSNKPLPFGTLGVHKKSKFKDANPCLFIFDCMYYNGVSLLDRSIVERRKILMQNMTEIKGHIMFSEVKELHNTKELKLMVETVLRQGLEGLVLKDLRGTYEPGKRHWQKIKKDYLFDGTIADSADLVVLGAWFGTGNKGGMMSIFLMGCYDKAKKVWCTVTKVHGGHDDKTLEKLQNELKMIKISKDPDRVPQWLKCNKSMIPDFVAQDPKKMPVWEITGAEYSQAEIHTANGISIRFPRVTKIRNDKTWETATTLTELQNLFELSKETSNLNIFSNLRTDKNTSSENESPQPTPEKRKHMKRTLDDHVKPGGSKTNVRMENNPVKKIKLCAERPRQPRLPDLFTGIRLVVPDTPSKSVFLRYFIAYGGTHIDTPDESSSPTHIIVPRRRPNQPPTQEHESLKLLKYEKSSSVTVYAQWFWDSIRMGKLLPIEVYQ
ncbi:Nucleic acid-binding, OB-fold,BRCT domain,DNA ligase 3, BRCT domain,DNA ligase, ATP-dependent,DNA [Cinara cedri]|uniref:DNA ligase n=1 Tax=Cinara cedri TaxID=506608 RepID=A0A5E4MD63_9HEMI|nr:Nucleic acid-binding, OB-fold,BRCT domain,DNA ligase 3, BRCT domain,DNA ligase, ATP-dependent,DNA [Cinara cedri]